MCVARSGGRASGRARGARSRSRRRSPEQTPKINQEKHLSQLTSESPLHTRASLYIRDVRDSCMTRCGQRRSAVGGPRDASVGQSRPHSHTTDRDRRRSSAAHTDRHIHPDAGTWLARCCLWSTHTPCGAWTVWLSSLTLSPPASPCAKMVRAVTVLCKSAPASSAAPCPLSLSSVRRCISRGSASHSARSPTRSCHVSPPHGWGSASASQRWLRGL